VTIGIGRTLSSLFFFLPELGIILPVHYLLAPLNLFQFFIMVRTVLVFLSCLAPAMALLSSTELRARATEKVTNQNQVSRRVSQFIDEASFSLAFSPMVASDKIDQGTKEPSAALPFLPRPDAFGARTAMPNM
jgi:hypothetical protein